MKKLVFIFAACAAVAFSACGNKTTKSEGNAATETTVVEKGNACKAACDSCDQKKHDCDSCNQKKQDCKSCDQKKHDCNSCNK